MMTQEERREYMRAYRMRHAETINARRRELYRDAMEDPERRARAAAASLARYHADPEYRERQAQYQAAYKERRRQDQAHVSRESASKKAAYARKKVTAKRTGDE